MHRTQRQLMVLIHNFSTGVDQGFLSNIVLQDMPEHIDGHTFNAIAHGYDTQVGGLRNNGGHQAFVKGFGARLMVLDRDKMTAVMCHLIYFHQKLFDTYAGHMCIDHFLQLVDFIRDLELVITFEFQSAVLNFREVVQAEQLFRFSD